MGYNADKLALVIPRLEAWKLENAYWVDPVDYFKFCVETLLAPQIVEEPFVSIWLRILDKRTSRKLELFPRETTKTSMMKAFTAYLLCAAPEWLGGKRCRVSFCGETSQFAKRNTKALRRTLESNKLIIERYGKMKPDKKSHAARATSLGLDPDSLSPPEWTQKVIRTMRCLEGEVEAGYAFEEPSCVAQGMDESTTGAHYNVVILDDPVTEKSAKSPARKEKAEGVFYDLQSQLTAGGLMIVVGTRHAVDDLHHMILTEHPDDFELEVHNCWGDGPELGREDFKKREDGSYELLRPLDEVEVFWAGYGQLEQDVARGFPLEQDKRKRRAVEYLGEKMYSIPPSRFANQYMNRAVADEDQVFFENMFRVAETVPTGTTYILTDSATGRDIRSSYRVVVAMTLDQQDTAYIQDVQFGLWSPEDYITRIIESHQRWGARRVLFEKVAWQESFKTNLKLVCRGRSIPEPMVSDVPGRSAISKIERIEGLEPRMRQGKLFFAQRVKDAVTEDGKSVWKEMIRQFTQVSDLENTRGLKLDIPDAISDIDALDTKGVRICRPPRFRRETPQPSNKITAQDVMAPYNKRVAKANRSSGHNIWQRNPSGKNIWG